MPPHPAEGATVWVVPRYTAILPATTCTVRSAMLSVESSVLPDGSVTSK